MDTVHWEYSSATPGTSPVSVPVYDKQGTAITLESNDELFITSFSLQVGDTAMRADLFIDYNAGGTLTAGERIAGGTFAANGGIAKDVSINPIPLPKGSNLLYVQFGSNAQGDVICHGYRRKGV